MTSPHNNNNNNNNESSHFLQFHPTALFSQKREAISTLGISKENRIPVTKPPTSANVYNLFHYLGTSSVELFMPSFDKMISHIKIRYPSLCIDIEKRKNHIIQMMRNFIRYLILIMLSVDERGGRMSEILSSLNTLYFEYDDLLIDKEKNNYEHVDKLHQLIIKTYEESLDMKTDAFYIKCSAEKNLGRTPITVKNNPPHQLNRIKAQYIVAAKTNPPVKYDEEDGEFFMDRPSPISPSGNTQREVDYYPVFLKILSVFRDTIPLSTNHGWFTQRLQMAVRKLSYHDWPMYGLVNSLLNMEALIEKKRIRLTLSHHNRRYYCSYSGLPLIEGEEVWLIRILVNSSKRHKLWHREGNTPAEPQHDPLLCSSIKNYLMKTSICAPQQLFYSDFPEDYKYMHPEYFGIKKSIRPRRSLPEDRVYQCNTLWYLMNRLIHFIEENKMHAMLFHNKESMPVFINRVSSHLLNLEKADNFQENLLRFILQSIFSVNEIEELPSLIKNDSQTLNLYLQQMMSIIIDFIDLMFDFTMPPPITSRNSNEKTKLFLFNLPELGIIESEEDKKKVLMVQPKLRIPIEDDNLLNNFFNLSKKRKEQLGTYLMKMTPNERGARLHRLQLSIKTHPFIFMLIYSSIYLSNDSLPQMSFIEVNKLLSNLSIVLSNK